MEIKAKLRKKYIKENMYFTVNATKTHGSINNDETREDNAKKDKDSSFCNMTNILFLYAGCKV